MQKKLFCFGLGYVAKTLVASLDNTWKTSGTHASSDKLKQGDYLFNEENNLPLEELKNVTHILISIPPTKSGDLVYLRYVEQLKEIKSLQWIGYFSSSAVYGDHQGNWVDEESNTNPTETLGKNRLIAEKQWLSSTLPVTILRLAGIYGEGRSVIDSINSGKATRIFKAGHYFSRIHVRDIVSILKAMMNNPKTHEIYNIADDFPSPQEKVIEFACNLMGKKTPEMINFESAILSKNMINYYMSSKRVDNNKVKRDYKIELEFPSYRQGLINLIESRKSHA
jgi:nucleoside-diphosphate-sugar epimerase